MHYSLGGCRIIKEGNEMIEIVVATIYVLLLYIVVVIVSHIPFMGTFLASVIFISSTMILFMSNKVKRNKYDA